MDEPGLVDSYRTALERLEGVAAQQLPGPLRLRRRPARPDAVAQAVADLGHELPSELVTLYRATNGITAFGFEIVEVEGLGQLRQRAQLDYDDIEESGLSGQIWGPRPQGDTMVISGANAQLLLLERNGAFAGRSTLFDVANDFGFRPVAPSLEAFLDAWAELAEAGLLEVAEAVNGNTLIDAPPKFHEQIVSLLANHPATPVCAMVLEPRQA